MFLETSRYDRVPQTETMTTSGRTTKAVKLRRLPIVQGTTVSIKQNDRLDILAQRKYDNPTQGWRIADGNSELQANDLIETVGRQIQVPEP